MSTSSPSPEAFSLPAESEDNPLRSPASLRIRPGGRAPGRDPGRPGRAPKLDEKLYQRMVQLGMTQQALSQKSGVSDSEISRLLNGQSKRPGLHNILRLARALEVSLDFLADDDQDRDPRAAAEPLSEPERDLLDRARALGLREVSMLLDAVRVLGFEVAIRRLYGLDPRPDADALPGAPPRP